MPKTLEEIMAESPQTPTGPGSVPPSVMGPYLSGMRFGSRGVSAQMTVPPPPGVLQQELTQKRAERQMQAETPVPTESERASTRVAKIGLESVSRIRTLLGAKGTEESPEVTNTQPMTPTVEMPFTGQVIRNPYASSDAKQLRDDLDNAFALLALLRTGKAGEIRQIQNIRSTHNIGEGEQKDPKTVIRRLNDLEKELRGFASGEIVSPMDTKTSVGDPLGLR